MLDLLQVECLGANQTQDTAGCTDDNVWAVLLQGLLVLVNWHTAEEDGDLQVLHVLGETLVLFYLGQQEGTVFQRLVQGKNLY